METPKWKTTVLGIVGAIFSVLTFVKPDFFSPETNAIISGAISAVLTAVLSVVAIFSAKDELKNKNTY
jgi:membrane associated rhomboid family serine protease